MAKVFKSLLIGIIVFSVAVLIGYISYIITYRYQMQKMEQVMSEPISANAAAGTMVISDFTEYYLARLENNDIAIYKCSGDDEAFMYVLGVRPRDLSPEDINRLKQGIVLPTKQRLAAFEEDFTG